MISCVLDASAVLAYLARESGFEEVEKLLDEAGVSAVNIAEVAGKLADRGAPAKAIRENIQALGIQVVPCDETLAYQIGELRVSTKRLGLSLGDRACLATAIHHRVRAVTADQSWKALKLAVKIHLIR